MSKWLRFVLLTTLAGLGSVSGDAPAEPEKPVPPAAPAEAAARPDAPATAGSEAPGALSPEELQRALEMLRETTPRPEIPAPEAKQPRRVKPATSHGASVKFDPRALPAVPLKNLAKAGLTNQLSPAWLEPSAAPFTIGPGDVLEIEMAGVVGSRATTLVAPDGKIYYHLLPGQDVWGLTLAQAKALLQQELLGYMRRPPEVTLTIRSVGSKRVWMLGRLGAPGIYSLDVPTTLLEAIAKAGGPVTAGDTDLASLEDSFVLRQGQLLPIDFGRLLRQGDTSQNIYLQPDDFIYLPSSYTQEVYVLGAVLQPMPVAFRHQVTLVTAVASAGGSAPGAFLSHVAIVRGSLVDPKVAIVNFRDILNGKASDILLEPRDIVYVPRSPYRFLGSYVELILVTFVQTVAINEGVRAVSSTESVVDIGITPTQK